MFTLNPGEMIQFAHIFQLGWFNHQPVTLPKTNMEPKNDGFQEESPFPGVFHFQVLLLMEEILHHFICSFSHGLQGFTHPRWCRISSINSMLRFEGVWFPKASIFKGNNRYLKTMNSFFSRSSEPKSPNLSVLISSMYGLFTYINGSFVW